MKGVILAAGEGNRLKPITSTTPKPMIPLAGRPLLEYTISGLKAAGIDEILLIVGYKQEIIKDYFDNGKLFGVNITYITQEEYLGTANAVGYAKDYISSNEDFMLMYGDLVVESEVFFEVVSKFSELQSEGLISLFQVDNPQAYGIISVNSEGFITKITEKPTPELNLGNLANAGIFVFNSLIFEAIEKTPKSIRGEYEFTDSMEILIKELGGKIFGFKLDNRFWSDIGRPWQLLEANSYLLDKLKPSIDGKIQENVNISGKVVIEVGTKVLAGTVIQGPCMIGKNSLIGPNAFIRPYSFIGDNCHIGMSEIKNSMVLSDSAVPHFNYVGDSIICEHVNLGAGSKVANLRFDNKSVMVKIKGNLVDSKRRKLGAIIGPYCKTGINTSIMCGKIVGEKSWIGAHTLVMEDVPPNTLYYFDPLKGTIINKEKQQN